MDAPFFADMGCGFFVGIVIVGRPLPDRVCTCSSYRSASWQGVMAHVRLFDGGASGVRGRSTPQRCCGVWGASLDSFDSSTPAVG